MVRSRLIVLAINLYLLVLLGFLGLSLFRYFELGCPENYGYEIFHGVIYIAGGATLLATVGQIALGVSTDRMNDDLLFVSSLTPGKNIRGRLACCFFTSLLFYSISAPFLSIAYLFRGVDIWMFAYYLPLHFLGIQIASLLAIAVFSAVRSWPQFLFYTLLFVSLFCGVALLLYGSLDIIRQANHGLTVPGARTFSGVVWPQVGFGCTILLTTIIFTTLTSYLFARCNFSLPSTNRMAPVRRWLSLFFILTFIIACVLTLLGRGRYHYFYHIPYLVLWIFLVTAILSAMLVLTVCERETWEGRLRRSIPKSLRRRLLAFSHFTGAVNGLFWVFLWTFVLLIGSSVLTLAGMAWNSEAVFAMPVVFQCLIFLMLIFNYSMTAFFLWKILLRRWVPREMIWTLTLALITLGTVVPLLLTLDANVGRNGFDPNNPLLAPSPLVLFDSGGSGMFQVVFAVTWFSSIMLLGYPWLRARFIDFTPNGPSNDESGAISPDASNISP